MNSWQWKTTCVAQCMPTSTSCACLLYSHTKNQKIFTAKKKTQKTHTHTHKNRTNTHTQVQQMLKQLIFKEFVTWHLTPSRLLITSGQDIEKWKGTYFFCLHSFQIMLLFCFCVAACLVGCFLVCLLLLLLWGETKKKQQHQSKHSEDRHSKNGPT